MLFRLGVSNRHSVIFCFVMSETVIFAAQKCTLPLNSIILWFCLDKHSGVERLVLVMSKFNVTMTQFYEHEKY
jgi:hypothetical protein